MPDNRESRREEKLDAGELNRKTIKEKNSNGEEKELTETQKKISNFWFYNKWKVIISLFVVFVIVVCTVQMCSNSEYDGSWMYAGSYYIPSEQRTNIENLTATYLPEDRDGDGVKRVSVTVINVYSDEQVEELNSEADGDDDRTQVNTETNQEAYSNFNNLILAGEYSICVIEPWLYKNVENSGGFRTLESVLGSKPEGAYSDYAVYLKDTAVYKDNPGLFDGFTDDTLICFRTESQIGKLFGSKGNSEEYAFCEKYFKNLVLGIQ